MESTAGSGDYAALANSFVTFAPGGATTQSRTIFIVDDDVVENPETFTVTATAVGEKVRIEPTNQALITIQDNDGEDELCV